jgi:hypothetical protein
MRLSPGRTFAGAAAAALLTGIVLNATMFQTSRHPAPLFGGAREIVMPQRPIEILSPQAAAPAAIPAPTSVPVARQAEPASSASAPQSMLQLLQQAGAAPAPAASAPAPVATPAPRVAVHAAEAPRAAAQPPAAAPAAKKDQIAALLHPEPAAEAAAQSSPRIAAVQKALKKVGYVLRPDGVLHPSTRQAIELFERENKLPVTGELNARTLRELAAQSGVAIP